MTTPTKDTAPTYKGAPDHFWEALCTGDQVQTAGITITEAHLVSWAGLTGDIVQFHLDSEYAAATPFGERVAHGPLTLSVSLGLLTQTGYMKHVLAWLGLDEVRAKAPVLIGDTITVLATVREARPTSKPGQGVWVVDYDTRNQRNETVMTFTSSFLLRRSS